MIRSKQQKGSMMIEVVAVVALLALLTPLLFRQIQRRTDEVDNVRIASFMREAKNALQRAMEDNLAEIDEKMRGMADNCKAWDTTLVNDTDKDPRNYAATPNFDQHHNELDFYVCSHEIQDVHGDNKYVYHGIVFDVIDTDLPFLAAADVATMIGAEGGVCTSNNTATGVRSAWQLNDGNFPCNGDDSLVAALSSMAGVSPFGAIDTANINDYISSNGSVQANIGYFGDDGAGNGGWVHIDNGLTVGDVNCITEKWDPNAHYDDANCNPIFEVTRDANGDGVEDDPAVVLGQNAKLIFENTAGDTYAAPSGNLNIPNSGNIHTGDREDTYQAGTEIEYNVDPTQGGDHASVFKDIRLVDRGNALLSQLLPDYILRDVLACNPPPAGTVRLQTFGFDCPPDHRKAVIVEGVADKECSPMSPPDVCWFDCTAADQPYRVYQYCVYRGN